MCLTGGTIVISPMDLTVLSEQLGTTLQGKYCYMKNRSKGFLEQNLKLYRQIPNWY